MEKNVYIAAIQIVARLRIVTLDDTIEGFGGKRTSGFLLKSELCQKCSKFRMQFCLGALTH